MLEYLALWGIPQATVFVFRPILEDLAKAVAKDISKSYVIEACIINERGLTTEARICRATARPSVHSKCKHQ